MENRRKGAAGRAPRLPRLDALRSFALAGILPALRLLGLQGEPRKPAWDVLEPMHGGSR